MTKGGWTANSPPGEGLWVRAVHLPRRVGRIVGRPGRRQQPPHARMRSRRRVAEFARSRNAAGLGGAGDGLGSDQRITVDDLQWTRRDANRAVREAHGEVEVAMDGGAPGESKRAARIGEHHDRKTALRIEDDALAGAEDGQRALDDFPQLTLEACLLRHDLLREVVNPQEDDAGVRRRGSASGHGMCNMSMRILSGLARHFRSSRHVEMASRHSTRMQDLPKKEPLWPPSAKPPPARKPLAPPPPPPCRRSAR